MINPIDHIVEYPDLSEAEIEALHRAVTRDAGLAALMACRRHIGSSARSAVGEDELFTLYSLHRAGQGDHLSSNERELVERQAHRFEKACADHPGLRIASGDVADAASEFSRLWDAHFETTDASGAPAQQEMADASGAPAGQEMADASEADAEQESTDASEADAEQEAADASGAPAEPEPAARPAHRHRATRKLTADRPAAEHFARGPSRGPRPRRAYRWLVRGAIAVAAVAFAVILTQVAGRDDSRITIQTAEGQTQLVELADGSHVRVMESSTFSYTDSDSPINRSADLEGRAYFEITPEGRGFLVETPTARITVLGTSFGIDARERLTEVVLTEGRLTLARKTKIDDFVVLEPGQMSRVVAGSSPSAPIAVEVSRRLTWTGLFIFQSTPLSDIASLLSEHFDVSISVDDELASERVTGTFEQSRPLDEILRIIASAVGARLAPDSAGGYALTHP